jgi:cGMP-dependent protein kinase
VSAEGAFEVFVGTKKVLSFGPGRAFGELAILYNTKRNATIRGKALPHSPSTL